MKKTLKSILAVVSAIVIVVLVCVSCSKAIGKCKCTMTEYVDGELSGDPYTTEVVNPGRCSDVNTERTMGSTKWVTTCVEK